MIYAMKTLTNLLFCQKSSLDADSHRVTILQRKHAHFQLLFTSMLYKFNNSIIAQASKPRVSRHCSVTWPQKNGGLFCRGRNIKITKLQTLWHCLFRKYFRFKPLRITEVLDSYVITFKLLFKFNDIFNGLLLPQSQNNFAQLKRNSQQRGKCLLRHSWKSKKAITFIAGRLLMLLW